MVVLEFISNNIGIVLFFISLIPGWQSWIKKGAKIPLWLHVIAVPAFLITLTFVILQWLAGFYSIFESLNSICYPLVLIYGIWFFFGAPIVSFDNEGEKEKRFKLEILKLSFETDSYYKLKTRYFLLTILVVFLIGLYSPPIQNQIKKWRTEQNLKEFKRLEDLAAPYQPY